MSSNEIKLPYGLKDNHIVHISEITEDQRGLKCGCVCPVCHDPLQARIGKIRTKHFAHGRNCETATETALHMLAKEIILNNKKIMLPDVHFGGDLIEKCKYFNYSIAEAECAIHGIRPDLKVSNGKHTLYIEIVVTHDIGDEKYEIISRNNMSLLKIDLEEYYFLALSEGNYAHLEDCLIHQQDCKEWINNKILNKKIEEAEKELALINRVKKEKTKRKIKEIIQIVERYPDWLLPTDSDIEKNLYWQRTFKWLRLKPEDVYDFLNYPIPGEIIFNCDRRIWQTTLFSMYVINNKYSYFKIEWVQNWIRHKNGLPLNIPIYFSWEIEEHLEFNLPTLADVLGDFFVNLVKHGFLIPHENVDYYDNRYKWGFYNV